MSEDSVFGASFFGLQQNNNSKGHPNAVYGQFYLFSCSKWFNCFILINYFSMPLLKSLMILRDGFRVMCKIFLSQPATGCKTVTWRYGCSSGPGPSDLVLAVRGREHRMGSIRPAPDGQNPFYLSAITVLVPKSLCRFSGFSIHPLVIYIMLRNKIMNIILYTFSK